MSWLYSQVLVEAFLEDTSLDGEQCVQSSGSSIPQAYCAPDKMTGFSRLSRFGMTYKLLEENHGEELLTLYLAAFRVPTFPQQEKEQELMEKPLECGEKWRGSFTKYDPDTSSWKTHQCSLLGDLEEFSETWPQWGLMRDGECWEQRTLEHRIRGTGYGLSPNGVDSFHTPNTTGLDGGSNSRKALKQRIDKWPTPTSSDWMNPKQNGIEHTNNRFVRTSLTTGTKFGAKLSDAVNLEMKKNWPTPQVSDSKDRGNLSNPSIQRRMEIGKQVNLQMCVSQTSGQLNPMWVEWLMGWPQGWTELKPSEMDKSHCVQLPHGES
jgi:DNA (cytosine-5)-methyltransferase 1